MRTTLVCDLSRQALSLAVDAHILGSVWRLAVGNGDGVAIGLASAHRTSIEICAIALAFSLGEKVFFEFLIRQMLFVFRT